MRVHVHAHHCKCHSWYSLCLVSRSSAWSRCGCRCSPWPCRRSPNRSCEKEDKEVKEERRRPGHADEVLWLNCDVGGETSSDTGCDRLTPKTVQNLNTAIKTLSWKKTSSIAKRFWGGFSRRFSRHIDIVAYCKCITEKQMWHTGSQDQILSNANSELWLDRGGHIWFFFTSDQRGKRITTILDSKQVQTNNPQMT